MAKQGYKLRRKSCRVLATGGEDHKVNLWAIGKPISILRLSGHTSPVESVTFDSAEVLVVAGASSGKIKLWDLEEAKIVQTFTGHRSNCISVDFHPFGELFASGSLDTGLKIWDIRRKGSIHTYKGHTRGVSSVRFTPDGRWVVSGGEDNTVKLWDLTAGKLLHNFKCHEGRIRCIDFHPQEYLLATGSADRTVKFWDLETFELIGATGPEATGVCSMIFNADGRTLFCGLHESLKVFSWEPMRCHDAVDVGWSGLADFNICEGKLLGCSSNQSCVGIWVVDISRIGPYAVGSMSRENGHRELKFNPGENQSLHQLGSSLKVNMTLLTPSQDSEIKEKKSSLCVNSACNSMTLKKNSMENVQGVPNIQVSRLGVGATMVPGNSPTVKPAINSTKETSTAKRMPPGMILSKPTHVRKPSNIGVCTEEQYLAIQSVSLSYKSNDLGNEVDRNLVSRFMAKDDITVAVEGSRTNIRNVAENFEKNMIHEPPLSYHRENYDAKVLNCRTGPSTIEPIKVEPGRTRSLVESWERRERCSGNEMPATGTSSDIMSGMHTSPYISKGHLPTAKRDITSPDDEAVAENIMQYHDFFRSVLQSRLRKLQIVRQFWEQNDVKGAINAMGKLSDHSIQVDVISVLMENIDIVKLGHCAWLLPVLTSLLDSKIDRHVGIALEMLLKLERIFRPLISSTLSASSPIGVDLQAGQRMDLCKECFIHLQKAKEPLPLLIKKGGLIAKSAQDLSQALQDS